MLDADGYLFGTTANFGYMSGALKHFFDTVYYPTLDHVAGRPYGLWVHGNNDTVGAVSSVEKVATGLSLAKAADALEITGAIDARCPRAGLTSWAAPRRDADGVKVQCDRRMVIALSNFLNLSNVSAGTPKTADNVSGGS